MESLVADVPLPMNRSEMREWWGWDELDILLVNGDAYVDHPSFGIAIIGRVLVDAGFRTGIIAQPQDDADWLALGRPRLLVGVSAGNLDSMLNHYTAARRLRSQDHYSPGGATGRRPDRATIAYANSARRLHRGLPLIAGGIEASMRRLAHWDHWSSTMRRSLLADSKADLLCYGMAEQQVLEIARRLRAGEPLARLHDIRGTCYMQGGGTPVGDPWGAGVVELPSFAAVRDDPRRFAEGELLHAREQDPVRGRVLVQPTDARAVVQNPPAAPLATGELDRIYALPYTRREHPAYAAGVPALETVRTSIVTHRGCVADCRFCAIAHHQGKAIQSRSPGSIALEAGRIAARPGFDGTISDVGGPSANMYGMGCARMAERGACSHRDCLLPEPCPNLVSGAAAHLEVLRRVRRTPGVRHAFVQSGIRFDLALRDGEAWLAEFAAHHVSGLLKVAPEATDDRVLALMNKPRFALYLEFRECFRRLSERLGKRQSTTEYLIAGHPGCDLATMVATAATLRRAGLEPDQVQEFIPLPMTLSTAMQVSGLDPRTMRDVATVGGDRERRLQKALLHSTKPENRLLVLDALRQTGRLDLAALLLGDRRAQAHDADPATPADGGVRRQDGAHGRRRTRAPPRQG